MRKLFVLLLLIGCASAEKENRAVHIEESTYTRLLSDSTRFSQKYDGFNNTLDVRVTPLTAQVREALTLKKATNFQWSPVEVARDRENHLQKMSSETVFFMSFFTPENKNDDLAKGGTVWRLFLDAGGKRYTGTVSKVLEPSTEVADLYPEHTRWGTPYTVKFLVPTRVIEEGPYKFTITGPLGSSTLEWP